VLRDLAPVANGQELLDDGISYRPLTIGAIAPIGQPVTGAAKRAVALMAALDPDLRDRVVSVVVTGDDLSALFSSAGAQRDLVARFGDETELEIKARALGALLGAGTGGNVAAIDLTVPDAPVLRLTGAKASISAAN
jgi:hypothetical protein